MKLLKRTGPPKLSEDDSRLLIRIYGELHENLPACRTLTERRLAGEPASDIAPEALARARGIAYVCRYSEELMGHPDEPLLDGIPEPLWPLAALGALTRVGYALSALAEEDVVDEALLTLDELDGLIDRYRLGKWLDGMRGVIKAAKNDGSTVELDLEIDRKLRGAPDVDGGRTELRRVLLADDVPDDADLPDIPGGVRPDSFVLLVRLRAIVILLAYRGALYKDLVARRRSPDTDAAALEAAVDIASVLQSLRRERELLAATRSSALDPGVANKILDDLFSSFVLLTGRDENEAAALLDPEWFDARLRGAKFREWVAALGFEPTFVTDAQAALSDLAAGGGGESEKLDRFLQWMRATRVANADSHER
jgi:hypothetical protein